MEKSNSFNCFLRLTFLIVFMLQCLNAQVTDTIYVEPGWNLLSLPVIVSDGSKSSLFPSAVSDAFIYQGSYIAKDTLENGFGFWLKFDTADSFFITGESIHRDTINVTTGWNIIGSLTAPVIVGTISSEPPGIINSDFFSYLPEAGYQQTDTLHPGFGYWVKVIQDGSIILFSVYNNPPTQPSNPNPSDNSVDVDTNLTISWTCSDPDDYDIITYDIYFDINNPPSTIISSNQADTSLALSNLGLSTTYYWKIVAKDSRGDSTTGPVWSFMTRYNGGGIHCPGLPYVVYEGKTYNTVLIGDQCWLKENLDIGTMIDSLQNPTDNGTIEKYCYRNDPANCNTYGGLYQWNEAMQYTTIPGARGICPSGWHIPTLTEYQILNTTVGNDCNALKAIGQGTGVGAGTNTSGFSALQGGGRRPGGSFDCLGLDSGFWGSTEYDPGYAYFMFLGGTASDISLSSREKGNGFSFRCVKD